MRAVTVSAHGEVPAVGGAGVSRIGSAGVSRLWRRWRVASVSLSAARCGSVDSIIADSATSGNEAVRRPASDRAPCNVS
jgi:high-affinity K+ transport system ATPase subunit B